MLSARSKHGFGDRVSDLTTEKSTRTGGILWFSCFNA